MFDALYDAEPDLEGGCELGVRSMTARAILDERERCHRIASEAGNIANMLWNDNVDAPENLLRREAAFAIASSIRSGAQHE